MYINKHQKEIDKATKNLINYAEKQKWSELKEDYFFEMLDAVANNLGTTEEDILQCLNKNGHLNEAIIYLLENLYNILWEGESLSLIEEYLKHRAWRDSPHARSYLRALSESFVGLYEVIDVKEGEYVELKEMGCETTQRVYDQSSSKSSIKWNWIAVRVLNFNKKNIFSGSGLMFSPNNAERFFYVLNLKSNTILNSIKQENKLKSTKKWTKTEIQLKAQEELASQFEDIIFNFWVTEVYLKFNQGRPILKNNDGDLIKDITINFPITEKHEDIAIILNASKFLDPIEESKQWAWISCDKNKIPESGTTLLGKVNLGVKSLKLTVNSQERADKGTKYLISLLGNLIGAPMSIDKNIDMQLENPENQNQIMSENMHNDEEAIRLIHQTLTNHYKKTLDEKVPALGNKTPRECAKNKKSLIQLIQWLKGLEANSASAMSDIISSDMINYDFKWMWKELGLRYPED